MNDYEFGTFGVYPSNEQDSRQLPQPEASTVIYTGPNIFALALMRFQVFKGGLPPYVKRAIERIPEIQQLLVPVSELEAMRQKIDKPGTQEARFFVAVQRAADALSRERKAKK